MYNDEGYFQLTLTANDFNADRDTFDVVLTEDLRDALQSTMEELLEGDWDRATGYAQLAELAETATGDLLPLDLVDTGMYAGVLDEA